MGCRATSQLEVGYRWEDWLVRWLCLFFSRGVGGRGWFSRRRPFPSYSCLLVLTSWFLWRSLETRSQMGSRIPRKNSNGLTSHLHVGPIVTLTVDDCWENHAHRFNEAFS